MAKHIALYKQFLQDYQLDALLIRSKTIKKHLHTLHGSGVIVLLTKDIDYLILDSRYLVEAKENEKDFEVILNTPAVSKRDYTSIISDIMIRNNYKVLGIEVAGFFITDVMNLKNSNYNLHYVQSEIDQLRIIKSEEEIKILKKACQLTDEILQETISHIHVGITENEICAYLHYYAYKKGASRMSFDPVITSGTRTALVHGRPTNRKVAKGEPIMIDFGIEYQGYQSDMTRMVFLGMPSKQLQQMYQVVKEAQTLGVDYVQADRIGNEVDKKVRDLIVEKGYGQYFAHGLGHGIGIGDGREYPLLNQTSTTRLKNGMIMSVEPGIYIPGIGGIRIEDNVVIINGKGVSLNQSTKDMIILENKDGA